ncbi:MAG: universal stress protein [Bacteroidota bacterium]
MKKILVPCDFSDTAYYAFEFACDIATKSGGEILVLHALEFPIVYETTFGTQPYGFDRSAVLETEAEARKNFSDMVSRHADPKIKTAFTLDYGPVTHTVRRVIEEKNVDLVVMGTHGASGFKEFFVGSNTEKVVRFSHVPVFSIKTPTRVSSIHHIVVPTVPDEDQSSFMDRLKELQQFLEATLHILYINTPVNFDRDVNIRREFDDYVKRYGLENYTFTIRNDTNEESGILSFVHETHADMIAMATHGRKGLAHLISGSLAEDVVNHISCPIWTCALKP